MYEFGTICKVNPREIWKNEAYDFTPWLEKNIGELGEAIGIDLEIVEREANVGNYSLDLLAKDVGRNENVIIENQLETTDHDHLGKLITYASGYDASVVVWVSSSIREEHRQALDWLNSRTDSSTDFFGVVIEILKIGNSKPALQFRVAVSPNEWQKEKKKLASANISEKAELYRQYFQGLIDELRDEHHFTKGKKAQPQNWYSFSCGSKPFKYSHSFARDNRVRVELYIDSGDNDINEQFYDRLLSDREQIESEFGSPLEWERLENKRASRIATYRPGKIEDSSDDLQEIHDWAIANLLKFKKLFGNRE